MPSPFYNTEGIIGLRKLTAPSKVHDIGTGFLALGEDAEKHLLGFVEHATSVTAKAGELVKATATLTVTAPTPALNTTFGATCASGETTIKTSAKIFGDFLPEAGVSEIKLLKGQHVILLADGTNYWINAGEPKATNVYIETNPGIGTEIEPSPTRRAYVSVKCYSVGGNEPGAVLSVGPTGSLVEVDQFTAGGLTPPDTFIFTLRALVLPGQKWKVIGISGMAIQSATTLLL